LLHLLLPVRLQQHEVGDQLLSFALSLTFPLALHCCCCCCCPTTRQLHEVGNQLLLHAQPTLLAIPGIVN
jgi:hypothetical protein